jgi:hypothetical protein
MQVEIAAASEDVDSSASEVVHDSRVGGTATGYGLDGSEFKPRSGQRVFLSPHSFRAALKLTETPEQRVPALFLEDQTVKAGLRPPNSIQGRG